MALMLACISICWLVAGCDRHEAACSVCGVANWTKYSPTGESFSVLMPAEPTLTTKMVDTKLGQLPCYIFSASPLKGHQFAVVHSTYPPGIDVTDVDKVFQQIETQNLKQGYHLVSKTNITLHGIPGRAFTYEIKNTVANLRVYLIDRDVYQVMTVMLEESVCQKHIDEFMESFQLNQK